MGLDWGMCGGEMGGGMGVIGGGWILDAGNLMVVVGGEIEFGWFG